MSTSKALKVNFNLIYKLICIFALRNTTWMEQKGDPIAILDAYLAKSLSYPNAIRYITFDFGIRVSSYSFHIIRREIKAEWGRAFCLRWLLQRGSRKACVGSPEFWSQFRILEQREFSSLPSVPRHWLCCNHDLGRRGKGMKEDVTDGCQRDRELYFGNKHLDFAEA